MHALLNCNNIEVSIFFCLSIDLYVPRTAKKRDER